MKRDDIAWLLVKASGLWLVIDGIYYLPPAVMTSSRCYGRWEWSAVAVPPALMPRVRQ